MAIAAPEAAAVDVILRDGGTLRLRPPAADDADALVAFFAALSAESRGLRFHGARRPDRALVEPFLEPDWTQTGALVGCLEGEVVALADYERIGEAATAEVAFVVADREQRRGIGTRLLEQLAVRARAA